MARLTLVNKEYGHVTVIELSKKAVKYIYGTIVRPAVNGEPECLGRPDKWDAAKYTILPGARWNLRELENKYAQARNEYSTFERQAEYEAENMGRELRDSLMDDWRKIHPAPENPLLKIAPDDGS